MHGQNHIKIALYLFDRVEGCAYRRHIDNMKLLLISILLLSHSFVFFRFCFLIKVCMVVFLFNTVIYVFYCYVYVLLSYDYVSSSCQLALLNYLD